MTYEEAVYYILELPKFTKKHSLAYTEEFLQRLGVTGRCKNIIHVAGTNGKGSVCAYLRAMLLSEGYAVGFFTSPHLVKMNERIKINDADITDEAFLDAFLSIKAVVDKGKQAGYPHPTFFEFLFGMAMTAFADAKLDYIILETGLGGRLDATNSVQNPMLTILSSISMDHMEILGDTIEKIAGEKAGIIKEGIPVICDADNHRSLAVIRKVCREKHASCREIANSAYEIKEITGKDIAFSSTNAYYEGTTWHTGSAALYQVKNLLLSLEAMQYISGEKEKHLTLWKKAAENVRWQGRMEEIKPDIWIDGAHNMGAIEAFVESVTHVPGYGMQKLVLLFSAVKEKEYAGMIAYLSKKMCPNVVITTQIPDERGVDAEELKQLFQSHTNAEVRAIRDVKEAFTHAVKAKGTEGRMYCLGSLYLAGCIKEMI